MTVQEIAEQSLKSLLASLGFSADIEVTETDGLLTEAEDGNIEIEDIQMER